MSIAACEKRSNYYQAKGWWTGERLESRFEQHAKGGPNQLAVADDTGRELTRDELWRLSGVAANNLAQQGVCHGTVVLLFLPNRIEWQIALLAVLRLQAVPASIATKTDVATLAYAADIAGCQLIVSGTCLDGDKLTNMAADAADRMARPAGLVEISAESEPKWIREPARQDSASSANENLDHIMFTSSTTGLPKGVMHSADTLGALNLLFSERFSLSPVTPIFMGSPLGHSVGAIHGARLALHTGAALILQEKWAPAAAIDLIDKYACFFTAAATPFLKDMMDHAIADAPLRTPLRAFLCGGAPVPPALLEQAWQVFPDTFVTNLWGMTEGGLVTCVKTSPKEKLVETAGIGLPGLELRVVDKSGMEVGTDEEGELTMRGPGVFTGYVGQQDLYQSLTTRDGFFHTGDLSRIDAEGYVRITGRLKDLIVRGGVNISPLPIEDVLALHPQIESIAVVGFPDERLGERICAVVTANGQKPSLDSLVSFAAEAGLAKRQLPEFVRYIDDMPRTAAGKIRKPDLQSLISKAAPDQTDLSRFDA